jgi:hypothetical protein
MLCIIGACWLVSVLEIELLLAGLLIANIVLGGFGAIHTLYARYEHFVLLSPMLRGHWRQLRRLFKPKHIQANTLRQPARGTGEIGDFPLQMRVLVNRDAVEIHAEAIPGRPVSIPWSEVEYVRIIPEQGGEALRAHLRVRQLPRMPIYIPWLAEFDRFLSVERQRSGADGNK